jgi:hypothetical protein
MSEKTGLSCVDEALLYLRRQIDPHDRLNPKYAYLHAAIEAVVRAKADILARQAPALILKHAEISRVGDSADFLIMRYAQRNPRVCCSNYVTGEPIHFGGRFQR